jgi:hypothetical protein
MARRASGFTLRKSLWGELRLPRLRAGKAGWRAVRRNALERVPALTACRPVSSDATAARRLRQLWRRHCAGIRSANPTLEVKRGRGSVILGRKDVRAMPSVLTDVRCDSHVGLGVFLGDRPLQLSRHPGRQLQPRSEPWTQRYEVAVIGAVGGQREYGTRPACNRSAGRARNRPVLSTRSESSIRAAPSFWHNARFAR